VRLTLSAHQEAKAMRMMLAIFVPFIAFFTIGKPIQGIVCFLLQLTLIGWLPAAIWAAVAVSGHYSDKRIDRLGRTIATSLAAQK
jgi:uncharacterized membrane protein YqaE (UPF0057 family)